jgi:hypothetical protein
MIKLKTEIIVNKVTYLCFLRKCVVQEGMFETVL